jgi:hypothetical protein
MRVKRVMIAGLALFLFLGGGCTNEPTQNDLQQAGETIREHAIALNPALRGQRLQVSGTIGTIEGGDDVCACLKVCDANGENCTACSCSPPNCGTC